MLAAALALLFASGAAWDASLHFEVRRPSPAVPQPDTPEVEADPVLEVKSAPGEFSGQLAYSPRFVIGGAAGAQPSAFNLLHALEAWQAAPKLVLRAEESAGYGSSIVSLLGPAAAISGGGAGGIPTTPATPEILPQVTRIQTINLLGGGSAVAGLAPDLALSGAASFGVSGGTNGASRAVMPLQHTPSGRAELDWSPTRLDSLSLTGNATGSLAGPRQQSELYSATLGWQRKFTRETQGSASFGIDYSHSLVAGDPDPEAAVLPQGAAALNIDFSEREHPLTLHLQAADTSAIDPLTIRVYQRAQGTLAFDLRPTPELLLTASGLAARAYGVIAGSMAQTDLRASWAFSKKIALTGGARAAWLAAALAPAGLAGFQWTAYIAIDLSDTGGL